MQGTLIFRSLSVLALAAMFDGCSPEVAVPGAAPSPSQTTMQQANSTTPPDRPITLKPSSKYFAKTGRLTTAVEFAVWANGSPLTLLTSANKSQDITKGMRGHATEQEHYRAADAARIKCLTGSAYPC